MKHERICVVCGKHYSYCGVCGEYNADEQWRNVFCSEDCKDVYHTICDYEAGVITKEQCDKKLGKAEDVKEVAVSTKKRAKKVEAVEAE